MPFNSIDRLQREQQSYERFIHYQFLFDRVVRAYVEISELPPITALDYDIDAPRSRTLTHDAVDFRVDVEAATETALRDLPALQSAWFELARADKVTATTARAVITRCGKLYQERGLDPNKYFYVFRRGGPKK
jgi:hypothetical protein